MANLLIGTNIVSMDEPCYFLAETNERTPDSKGVHRYQSITVIRNDQQVVCRRDLGPAANFDVEEFQIPGGATDPTTGRVYIEETVGRLIEIANILRERPREQTRPQNPNLIQVFRDQPDIRRRVRKKVSTFGYGGTIQRD